MNPGDRPPRRIAIVGAGIAGLAAAWRLSQAVPRPEVAIFEAGPRAGGVLQTTREDGWLIEHSADNFITNVPWALELCRNVGLGESLLPTDETRRRALVVHRGKLYRVPEGFLLMAPGPAAAMLASPILSVRGKLRLLAERWIPQRAPVGDESVASFARRRLGRETFERLVQPLVGGIYTADAERLSLAATMPRFLEMEREYGSLTRAMLRGRRAGGQQQTSGARYGLFAAPRDGMGSLVAAIVQHLPEGWLRLSCPVERIRRSRTPGVTPAPPDGSWEIETSNRSEPPFDALILATPAHVSARLLADVDSHLSGLVDRIPFAGGVIAVVGYRREQIEKPLDGFGFVVPETERRDILAASFSSEKFPGRAPPGHVLIRVFLGGAKRPEQLELPDNTIREIVARELGSLLGVKGEPELFRVIRWPQAMPQYHLGHLELVAEIKQHAARIGRLALAGCALEGVGVPHCIHSGNQAAEQLLAK